MNQQTREERKRLKRERKKRERLRQGQRQPNPAVAVCLHDADVPITGSLVLSVWTALRAGQVVDTVPAPEMGEERKCWHNVRRLVERHGGHLVLGWGVGDLAVRDEIRPQKNRHARTFLNAHAVWLHEGRFHETCPERLGMGMRFLLAERAAVLCDASVEFFDAAEDARSASWPAISYCGRPFTALLVDLRRQPVGGGEGPPAVPAPNGHKPYPYTIWLHGSLEGRVDDGLVAARVRRFAWTLDPARDAFIDEGVLRDPSRFPMYRRACVVWRDSVGGVPVEVMATQRDDGTLCFVVYDPASPVSPTHPIYRG